MIGRLGLALVAGAVLVSTAIKTDRRCIMARSLLHLLLATRFASFGPIPATECQIPVA